IHQACDLCTTVYKFSRLHHPFHHDAGEGRQNFGLLDSAFDLGDGNLCPGQLLRCLYTSFNLCELPLH
ncbi:MAG: hypothetical protein WBN41_08450, partial [Lysobacterales bacterium]